VVPSSFRILRHVLDRLEDSATGRLLPPASTARSRPSRVEQAQATAQLLGDEVWKRFPWACGADGGATLPTTTDPVEALLNRTWRPTLSVTGVDGFPELKNAGNVLRPYTAFKLSACACRRWSTATRPASSSRRCWRTTRPTTPRSPSTPTAAPARWAPPAGTRPSWRPGWKRRSTRVEQAHFGAPVGYIGQGGTIPLMSMLQQGFPQAQMMVCGVLGPKSNAHGPNEFLHVPYGKKLTAAVAQVIAACP
jgi:hypothetical protein